MCEHAGGGPPQAGRPFAACCTFETPAALSDLVPEQRMEYHDKVLKCADCGAEFVFTAGEQMFFVDKGFKNEPKRCKACKGNRAQGNEAGPSVVQRVETKTVCSQCGKETTVPFKPTQGRPVYCRECFQQRRSVGPASATA
jgi:CxxC-x17-CxxC domain-containing protein